MGTKNNYLYDFFADYELPEDFMEELDRLQDELESRQAQFDALERELNDRQKSLDVQQRKMDARQARLDVIEEKLKERFSKLKEEEERLEVENRGIESQQKWLKQEERTLQEERSRFEAAPISEASEVEEELRGKAAAVGVAAPWEPGSVKANTETASRPAPERKQPAQPKVKQDKKETSRSAPGKAALAAAGGALKSIKKPKIKRPERPVKPEGTSAGPARKRNAAPKKKDGRMRIGIIIAIIAVLILGLLAGIHLGAMDWVPGVEKARTAIEEGVAEAKMPDFEPAATENTRPENLIKETAIMVGDEIVDSYQSDSPIDFGYGSDYTDVEGIVTFRGNNFRESSSYGTADIVKQKFGESWVVGTGALKAPDGEVWTGSGWVGQPLMMTWPKEVRQNMNMHDWAKEAEELTEVIYATMDGHIYFLDLETGEKTRDPMYLGYTFKGAGALDPRGYPIMYLGSGYDSTQGKSRVFIINLIDCEVMYTFGNADSFSKRGTLSYFDGSALVDAETDKLIYPGENGILYIYTLNTFYDEANGVLSVTPSPPVKWRYYGKRSGSMYLGMEDSAIIWRGHIFFTTNDGYLFCLDLNTLETVWVQDVLDDTNCTSTLELEDGHPYLYVSTSFHLGWRSNTTAEVPVWKIDAENGEIVWKTSYECRSTKGNSGGVQGSIALGKNGLSDLIFVPVARTPSVGAGFLVALDKKTGKEAWKLSSPNYSWSSPVAVYDKDGKGYICFANSVGKLELIDGLTGEVLDSMELGGNVEASPAVFNNKLVVGTRGCKIFGIDLE